MNLVLLGDRRHWSRGLGFQKSTRNAPEWLHRRYCRFVWMTVGTLKKCRGARARSGRVCDGSAAGQPESSTHWSAVTGSRKDGSIKKFVQTARRYRTVQIRAGNQLLTAADPIPAKLREALAQII